MLDAITKYNLNYTSQWQCNLWMWIIAILLLFYLTSVNQSEEFYSKDITKEMNHKDHSLVDFDDIDTMIAKHCDKPVSVTLHSISR